MTYVISNQIEIRVFRDYFSRYYRVRERKPGERDLNIVQGKPDKKTVPATATVRAFMRAYRGHYFYFYGPTLNEREKGDRDGEKFGIVENL